MAGDPLAPTHRLLCGYEAAMARAEALPVVQWAPWRPDGPGRHLIVPNVRMFVRHFLVLHMRRTVAVLVERHHVRLATGLGVERDTLALERLGHFESVLSSRRVSLKRMIFMFAIPAFVAALLLTPLLSPADGSAEVLRNALEAAFVDQSLRGVYDAAVSDPAATVTAFVIVSTLTLALLAVPMASFGRKRAIMASTAEDHADAAPAGFPRQARASGGLYALEERVQRELGVACPRREVPLDLLCVALGLSVAFPLWLMLGVVAQDRLPSGIAGLDSGGALVPWIALGACVVWVPWRFVRVTDLWLERNGMRRIADRLRDWLVRRVPMMIPGEGRRPGVAAEPASWRRRLAAGLVDGVFVLAFATVLAEGFRALVHGGESVAAWVLAAAIPVAGLLWGVAFTAAGGRRTPGKALLGVTVLGRAGPEHRVSVGAAAGREALKWLVYGFGGLVTLGLLLAIGVWRTHEDGRLLHDRVFGTAVVDAAVPVAVPAQPRLRIGA